MLQLIFTCLFVLLLSCFSVSVWKKYHFVGLRRKVFEEGGEEGGDPGITSKLAFKHFVSVCAFVSILNLYFSQKEMCICCSEKLFEKGGGLPPDCAFVAILNLYFSLKKLCICCSGKVV